MYSGTVRRVSRQDIKLVTVSMDMVDNGTSHDLRKECFYGGGLSAYITWLNANKKPLHEALSFRKEVDGVTMEIALQWCVDGYSDTMLGYANSVPTVGGGTHIDGVKSSITRTLNQLAKMSNAFKDEDVTFTWEHVRKGLTCIVSVIVPHPEFEGPEQKRLGNPYVKGIVDHSVEEYLMEYFELHPDALRKIISKALNMYEVCGNDLAAMAARELIRSRSVPTPCTVPEKQTHSDKSETVLGGGESSGDAGNHDSNQRLQSKRPRRNGAIYTASGVYLEDSSPQKGRKPDSYVPSPQARFSSRRTVGSTNPSNNHKDVSKKTPTDVTNCKKTPGDVTNSKKAPRDVANCKSGSKKTLKDVTNGLNKTGPVVPIGPSFQAELPVWVAPTRKGKFYGSPGDSDTLRWLGSGVWPTYSLKKKVYHKKVGEGRSDTCTCATPKSPECIQLHIKESRELLEKDLGQAFYTWKFNEMGEAGLSKPWTGKEEQRFEALLKKHPLRTSEGFWKFASKDFPTKSKKDLIDYYRNVYLIKRMRLLANSPVVNYESDDDNYNHFLSG